MSLPSPSSLFNSVHFGTGVWSWGDRLFWGFGKDYSLTHVQEAFQSSINSGVTFFDTAESYGQGKSETILGKLIKSTDQPVIVATKFMPYPWRLSRNSLIKALKQSLHRLDLPCVDLYQIHFPFPPVPIETWMEAMGQAVREGLTRAVGVSNFDGKQMQQAIDALARQGIPLASNQVEYHLLNRRIEKNGLLERCRDQGVALIAYSPLAQGLLTGKFTPEHPPAGIRAFRTSHTLLHKIQPLIKTMLKIGAAHGEKTPAQVALNWLICKGAIPIPGAKTGQQASQNAGALGWMLSEDEVALLDQLTDEINPG